MVFYSVLIFLVAFTTTYSAHILAIVTTPCFSHQVGFRAVWRELSLRGHHLLVLTTNPMNDPTLTNLKEIDMGISYEKINQWNPNAKIPWHKFLITKSFHSVISDIGEEQLLLPEVQGILLNKTERFDLVMIESFFLPAAAFSERFNCPLIQMFSLESFPPHDFTQGNPSHPSLNPHFVLGFYDSLTFFERLQSAVDVLLMSYLYYYEDIPSGDVLIKKYFETHYNLPSILDETSIMFVNTDTLLYKVRPLIPNVVQFGGGSHIMPPKPLPNDLQTSLDNATNGFIYFSLGSTLRCGKLPQITIKTFLETFAELPYTVLWKYESEDIPEKFGNIIISKWLPQQDILRHPNIKLFINQGGLQSSEEAFYNNVPILGIPFIGDQSFNMKRFVSKGLALSVDHRTMNKSILKSAIMEMLNNPSYRNKTRELVELTKRQPMSGLERAVWWTEYVIRHNGTAHSRSPAMNLCGCEYFLLDVISFLLAVLGTIAICVMVMVKPSLAFTKYNRKLWLYK